MQTQVDVAVPVQVAGLALLVLFAGTFGGRWALLAGGLALLLVGVALSGVQVAVRLRMPGQAPAAGPAPGR